MGKVPAVIRQPRRDTSSTAISAHMVPGREPAGAHAVREQQVLEHALWSIVQQARQRHTPQQLLGVEQLPPPQVDARVPSLHHRVPVVGLGAVGRQPQHAARRTNVGYTTHTISTPRARTGLESRPSALLSRHRSPSPSRFGAACAPCASSGPWSASPRPSYACPCVSCSECRRVRRAARERAAAQGRAPGAIGGDQGEIRARSGRDQREIRGDRGPAPASAHPRARGP